MRRALVALVSLGAVAACGDGGADADAFCATAERFAVENPAAALAAADLGDRAATADALEQAADELDGWAGDAPEEVADDARLLAEAASDLASQFAETSLTSSEEHAPVDATAVAAASAVLLDYARIECGVDLDPVEVPAGSTPPSG